MGDATFEHHDYWDSFYAGRASNAVPDEPSLFARWVDDLTSAAETVVAEFGFGTARDSLWFARHGYSVIGFDFAESAVEAANTQAGARELGATFHELDLYDAEAVRRAGKLIMEVPGSPVVYGRFLIHSLEDAGRHHLFDMAAEVLQAGGLLCLEFRTGQDEGAEHVFGDDHFRVYLDPEVVAHELVSRGASVVRQEAGYGLAPYKTEDPHVARLVVRWSD